MSGANPFDKLRNDRAAAFLLDPGLLQGAIEFVSPALAWDYRRSHLLLADNRARQLAGARECLFQSLDRSCIPRSVSWQLRNGRLKFFPSHNRKDTFHGFQFKELFSADEKVVLRHQANEVKIELPGRGLHTETDISHAARDIGGDRGMREFDVLIAVNRGTVERLLREELFEQ